MYQILLSLHIIFIVTWFAGLFYIVRIFVYQSELVSKPAIEKEILAKQYKIMAKRLWFGITWPSFIITAVLGPSLLIMNKGLLTQSFMHIKLGFVAGLFVYHFICHIFFKRLQADNDNKSSNFYRLWNELATLFLVAIVFIIVMKNQVNWIYGTLGFFAFGILLMLAIKIYKKIRTKND
jgi:putative membrane protein